VGVEVDIFGGVVFAVATIVSVVIGVRRRAPSKRIRERAGFLALLAVNFLRGLFPINSWRVSGIYFAVLLAIVLVALWKGPRSKSSTP